MHMHWGTVQQCMQETEDDSQFNYLFEECLW